MSAPIRPPPLLRKPRYWPLVIIPICLLAPLVMLLGAFVAYRASNAIAVSRLEAKIKQKGEPLTLADLAATYPPIPDEENGAILLLVGLTRFDGHLGGGALTESANEQDQDC